MLNYLNTIFTFGKQTKDNFITRKLQSAYILIHSLIFVPAFPLGRVAGAAALGWPETPHDQHISADSTRRRYQARSEMYSRHLVLGRTLRFFPVGVDCSPKDLVRHSFLGHSGYMPTWDGLPSLFLAIHIKRLWSARGLATWKNWLAVWFKFEDQVCLREHGHNLSVSFSRLPMAEAAQKLWGWPNVWL